MIGRIFDDKPYDYVHSVDLQGKTAREVSGRRVSSVTVRLERTPTEEDLADYEAKRQRYARGPSSSYPAPPPEMPEELEVRRYFEVEVPIKMDEGVFKALFAGQLIQCRVYHVLVTEVKRLAQAMLDGQTTLFARFELDGLTCHEVVTDRTEMVVTGFHNNSYNLVRLHRKVALDEHGVPTEERREWNRGWQAEEAFALEQDFKGGHGARKRKERDCDVSEPWTAEHRDAYQVQTALTGAERALRAASRPLDKRISSTDYTGTVLGVAQHINHDRRERLVGVVLAMEAACAEVTSMLRELEQPVIDTDDDLDLPGEG